MVPICYNGFVKSGRFSRALRTMLARHFVLLTPLECADPSSIPISILNARITLLESALTSHSQVAENTANLSLLECALTSFPSVTPLECALPKNTGGGGRSSHLRTRRSPLHLRPQRVSFQAIPHSLPKNGGWGGVLFTWTNPTPSNRKLPHLPSASPAILRDAGSCSMSQNSTEEFLPLSDTFDEG